MAEVPRSAEERAAVRTRLLRQAKAACLAGRHIEEERLTLERLNFCARCELEDARLDQSITPDELAALQEEVRVSNAGLKALAAQAAAAGER